MQTHEYDATLFYLHRMACTELMTIMTLTADDFLAKKIENFVKAYMYDPDFTKVERAYNSLLRYLDHVFVSHIDERVEIVTLT
ncbi:YhdB family protein [Pueribacillus sp. YX66]|uniref:YhdB family protein n=1 Tax=Pueribacillus sp. YX66 TaxID=3229242 RepID=UPI00358D96A1